MPKPIKTIPACVPLPKRKRVAAYARVSSGKDAMLHSLAAQVSVYSRMIQSNSAWEYAGVYADEAFTGTKNDRPEFQRLLKDCRLGKIDMIITKSISRFARNTVTVLETVRELRQIGVDVYFEENSIHSLATEGELLITILSSFAQAESYSASENQKWRIRTAYQNGEIMNWRFMYGYNITKDSIEVNEDEAAVVREIFERALHGESFGRISADLNKRGLHLKMGGKFCAQRIGRILCNEKYVGATMLQKTYVNNHLEKKIVKNKGELPRVYVEDSHPAIIDKETFDAVQVILRNIKAKQSDRKLPKRCELTGHIICPKCNKPYRHVTGNGSTGWNCSTYVTKGKAHCHGKKIPDDTLKAVIAKLLGLPVYEPATFSSLVDAIYPYEGNRLVFVLNDGTVHETTWQDRNRKLSWTPEMREKARVKAREQATRRGICAK